MPLVIASRRAKRGAIATATAVIDVTSRGVEPWRRLSPFYPHGDIPVPFSPGCTSESVEGIWQGLKVFERADVDTSRFRVTTMTGLKRSTRVYGRVLGHRMGVHGDTLLPYITARYEIYLPAYRWVLDHCVKDLIGELRSSSDNGNVVLLDYTVNGDIDDSARPLSHAALIKRYIEDDWPLPDGQPGQETRQIVR